MTRLAATLVLFSLAACYASHEVGGPADAGTPDDAMCSLGTSLIPEMRPPLPSGLFGGSFTAKLRGIDGDPVAGTLTFHFDTCPPADSPECLHDLVLHDVGDLSSGVPFGRTELWGQLDWHTGVARFYGSDGMCGGCGHSVELVAGTLAPFESPTTSLRVSRGSVECADACNDYGGLHVEGYGAAVTATTGLTARDGALIVHVSSAREDACRRCRCTLPDAYATGVVYAFTGGSDP